MKLKLQRDCGLVQPMAALILLSLLLAPAALHAAPAVNWEPSILAEAAPAGGSRTVQAQFTTSKRIRDASVRVVRALKGIVSVHPEHLGNLPVGEVVELQITITPPAASGPMDVFDGAIQIRSGSKGKNGKTKKGKRKKGRTVSKPLPVEISVVGAVLGPKGGTVIGADASTVTLARDSIGYRVEIDISTQPVTIINADPGELPLLAAFQVDFQPVIPLADVLPPTEPLEVTIPVPSGVFPEAELIIAQEIVTASFIDEEPGLRPQLVPVGVGTVNGDTLLVEPGPFQGIVTGGTFAVVEGTGSGYAIGVVTQEVCTTGEDNEETCSPAVPQPGVTVSNSTNTLVSVTDWSGRYALFISGDEPFDVTGFNPFLGSSGTTGGNIVVDGDTVTADIILTTLPPPELGTFPGVSVSLHGIRNGGFELCNLSNWGLTGIGRAIRRLESSAVTITPTEGRCMADISTETEAVGEIGSALVQQFIVPAGAQTLRFDVNFVSEEFPEWVNEGYDDAFVARIRPSDGDWEDIVRVSVDNSGGYALIGDCNFPGGDNTCGQTGWREASIDLSDYAGTDTPITVELLFSSIDQGDDIFDTHVLIDNIRFGTLWIDAKIINGAGADSERVEEEVREANEILSQAGLNVRIRRPPTIEDSSDLLATDVTWTTGVACSDGRLNGQLTTEESAIVGLSRSDTPEDLNVYYVQSLTVTLPGGETEQSPWVGIALGPDDFCTEVDLLTNSGVLIKDRAIGDLSRIETLAHEIGHITITPAHSATALEHNINIGSNLMESPRSIARGVVSPAQAVSIINGPLVVD